MSHICVSKLTIIGSDNGLSPDRRQAIIWTYAGLLSIRPLWTYFSENRIKMQQFSLKKMQLKMSSAKWRPSCLRLNVLKCVPVFTAALINNCLYQSVYGYKWHSCLDVTLNRIRSTIPFNGHEHKWMILRGGHCIRVIQTILQMNINCKFMSCELVFHCLSVISKYR